MKKIVQFFFYSFILFSCISCELASSQYNSTMLVENASLKEEVQKGENLLQNRFLPPKGYIKVAYAENSFGNFLQQLPLKPHGSVVKYYNGKIKPASNVYKAVVDLPIGTKNLHQCADAIIRLRADYLRSVNRENDIAFHFTNGFYCDYKTWKQGNTIAVNGNNVQWQKLQKPKNYWSYLETVFMYAGTLSLQKELQPKPYQSLEVGDVFIQGGSPGHAVIVVNKAIRKSDQHIIYMLAQSYMPAQEIQILNHLKTNSVWYSLQEKDTKIETPEWSFNATELRTF